MRCGQSISGALLCSDSGCPDTASLLSFCEHLPSHIPWFSAKLPEGSSLGQPRPNTWYAVSLPLSPATHVPQRPILYKGSRLQGIVRVGDGRLRLIIFSGTDPWLLLPALRFWGSNCALTTKVPVLICHTPKETEQSSSEQEPAGPPIHSDLCIVSFIFLLPALFKENVTDLEPEQITGFRTKNEMDTCPEIA